MTLVDAIATGEPLYIPCMLEQLPNMAIALECGSVVRTEPLPISTLTPHHELEQCGDPTFVMSKGNKTLETKW